MLTIELKNALECKRFFEATETHSEYDTDFDEYAYKQKVSVRVTSYIETPEYETDDNVVICLVEVDDNVHANFYSENKKAMYKIYKWVLKEMQRNNVNRREEEDKRLEAM